MRVPRRHVDAGQRQAHEAGRVEQREALAQLQVDFVRHERIALDDVHQRLDGRDQRLEHRLAVRGQIGMAGDAFAGLHVHQHQCCLRQRAGRRHRRLPDRRQNRAGPYVSDRQF